MLIKDYEQLKDLGKEELQKRKTWYLITGILLILAGACSLIFPAMSSLYLSIFVGCLFLIGGIMIIVQTINYRKYQNFGSLLMGILLGVAYCFLGYEFIAHPLSGVVSLALLLGMIFLFVGLMRLFLVFSFKNMPHRGIYIFLAILEVILAVLLLGTLFNSAVQSSILLVSIFAGMQFICNGFSYCFLSSSLNKIIKNL